MLSEGDEQASCWAKACWVGQETLADCWILHGPLKLRHWVLFNPQWKAHISCSDTSSVNVSTLNHRKALTISSIEIMDFFPSLGLVLCGCVEMWVCPSRLQKARSCSTRQPVEAWPQVVNTQFPNLRPWRRTKKKKLFFLIWNFF